MQVQALDGLLGEPAPFVQFEQHPVQRREVLAAPGRFPAVAEVGRRAAEEGDDALGSFPGRDRLAVQCAADVDVGDPGRFADRTFGRLSRAVPLDLKAEGELGERGSRHVPMVPCRTVRQRWPAGTQSSVKGPPASEGQR